MDEYLSMISFVVSVKEFGKNMNVMPFRLTSPSDVVVRL